MKRVTREDLLDEIENGAQVIRKPVFNRVPDPPQQQTVQVGLTAEQVEDMLEEHQAAIVDTISAQLKAINFKRPKGFKINTYRDGNDNLQGEITVIE